MKPRHHDEPLARCSKEWRSAAPLPPRFQEQVWQESNALKRNQSPVWAFIDHLVGTVLPRPALAASYLQSFSPRRDRWWAQARRETVRVKRRTRPAFTVRVPHSLPKLPDRSPMKKGALILVLGYSRNGGL